MAIWDTPAEDFPKLPLPSEVFEAYPPDRQALFDTIRPLVTDAMLGVVANSDYNYLHAEHFAALQRIRDGIDLDEPIGWVPNEVLTLFRWSEEEYDPILDDADAFHIARAFCCSTLLRIPDVHENRSRFDNDAFAPLIESCLLLGEPFRQRLLGLLTYSLQEMESWDEDFLFVAFGLLATVTLTDQPEPELGRLVATWVLRANREVLPHHFGRTYPEHRTFIDIRYASTAPERWARLAQLVKERHEPTDEISQFSYHASRLRRPLFPFGSRDLGQTPKEVQAALNSQPTIASAIRQLWEMRRKPRR
jgi:hypothetical protein